VREVGRQSLVLLKNLGLALLALAAGGAIAAAVIYLESRPYFPAVRVAAPGDVTYTALLAPQENEESCNTAVRRFIAPISRNCRDCRVLFKRCERSSISLPSEDAPRYWIESTGLRIAIAGPEANARASCELLAADLNGRGLGGECSPSKP
jgi:hypothetical protein